MNKVFMLSTLCAAALLTACSSEAPEIDKGTSGVSGEPQFLTVNLVTNTTNGTRADEPQPAGAEYEAGEADENEVTKVRFYFFTSEGGPAYVRNENNVKKNWLDWNNLSVEGADMPNVEKILSATLVIQTAKDDGIPSQLVAIINPTEEPNAERSLENIVTEKKNYQTYKEKGKFVMSNSTYADDGVKKFAVNVEGKLYKTSGEALNDPVQIYVERTVAKVRLNCSLTGVEGSDNIYTTSTADKPQTFTVYDEEGNETTKDICVKFLGWNTTAVADQSRLIKEINPSWAATLLGTGGPWNWEGYKRSFWAVNADGVEYQYGAFKSTDKEDNIFVAQANTKFDKTQWVYINENATPYNNDPEETKKGLDPTTKTKVIIGAQLVDKDGNPLEFAEYGSTRTTVDGLKNLFANNCGLYKKQTYQENEEWKVRFIKITPADLTIKTATAIGAATPTKDGRYKSYVQIGNETEVWYGSNAEDAEPLSLDDANKQLKDLGSAKVWTNGYTYYYFDIKHLGGRNGVVRNHIYDANVTSLAGLGTPVYDPDEIIYPEHPQDDDDTFIAAQINILSWRIVKNDVSLEW